MTSEGPILDATRDNPAEITIAGVGCLVWMRSVGRPTIKRLDRSKDASFWDHAGKKAGSDVRLMLIDAATRAGFEPEDINSAIDAAGLFLAPPEQSYFQLHADGGIVAPSGQPAGEASIGVALRNPDGSVLHTISVRIGRQADHHVAEYRALIAGLRLARGHGIDHLRVFLDSAVVVDHINLRARTKQDYIDHLTEALALKREFADIEIAHVPRQENKEAHTLADEVLRPLRVQK